VQALLMLIEADAPEPVVESLTKGCSNKTPKISAVSISTLREALRYALKGGDYAVCSLVATRLFGAKVIPIKPLMKEFPPWFENRDKAVRTEASQMVVEMYRWLGKALTPAVEALNAVQVSLAELINCVFT
jgi:cytoskeleton-associated protein 5